MSRYDDVESYFVLSHSYDMYGDVDVVDNGDTVKNTKKTNYRLTALPLPKINEANRYMAKVTDNFTLISQNIYKDDLKWWVICDANPQIRHPLDLKTADIIYLPS